ncbi:MAG: LmeA family phospholipid-binding protein [Armatimonadota bacterium]
MAMLFAVLVLGALGSKIPTDADIAARIEDAIRTQLHPEKVRVVVKRPSALSTTFEQVEITISGFNASQLPLDALPAAPAGEKPARPGRQIRIVNARLTCENFVVNGLPVDTLAWQGSDVYLPFQSVREGIFHISSARSVNGYVVVKEDDLTKFLRTLTLPITEPSLSITPAECQVEGVTRLMVKLPIRLSGRLAARNGAMLYLDDARLRVTVVPIPKFVSNRVLKDLNPLADLNQMMPLPAPLEVTRLTQQHGALRIEGALLFPKPPEKK